MTWLRGLRQQRDVFGHDAGLEAGVGIGRAVGGIGERRAAGRRQARHLVAALRAAGPIGGVAHARDDVVDRQRGCDLDARQHAGEVARHVGDFGVGLGAGAGRRSATPSAPACASSFCALNGGTLAANSEVVSDRLADTRTNGRTRTTSRSPTRVVVLIADDLARARWLRRPAAAGRSCGRGEPVADRADGAAQRALDPLGHGGEIGLAVERRKNGAAHQGRAADAGQDRAGKPLHRDAAAIDRRRRCRRRPKAAARCRDRWLGIRSRSVVPRGLP